MNIDGINEQEGSINLHELLPAVGDSVMIVNRGDHFELNQQPFPHPTLLLTNDEIERIRKGTIIWN